MIMGGPYMNMKGTMKAASRSPPGRVPGAHGICLSDRRPGVRRHGHRRGYGGDAPEIKNEEMGGHGGDPHLHNGGGGKDRQDDVTGCRGESHAQDEGCDHGQDEE